MTYSSNPETPDSFSDQPNQPDEMTPFDQSDQDDQNDRVDSLDRVDQADRLDPQPEGTLAPPDKVKRGRRDSGDDDGSTDGRDFEDLTVAEMLGQLLREPVATMRALALVVAPLRRDRTLTAYPDVALSRPVTGRTGESAARKTRTRSPEFARQSVRLALYGIAIVLAWMGNTLYVAIAPGDRFNLPDVTFVAGAPFLAAAFILVIVAEIVGIWGTDAARSSSLWRLVLRLRGFIPAPEVTLAPAQVTKKHKRDELRNPVLTTVLLAVAVFTGLGAYFFNGDNRFTPVGVFSWIASIALLVAAVSPASWNLLESIRDRVNRVYHFLRTEWETFFIVLLITGGAAFIRLQHIDTMLPEMTSDHVEKLLDAQHVSDGEYRVFMEENGGRESLHFYLLALIDQIPGIDLNFMALKILSALEGIVTIPIFWWLGRELIGDRDRRLAAVLGIAMALVGAVMYWHIQLSRIALRISLTPLFGALLLIYLSRAMRYNRRADFIKAGLVLGTGLYAYQAVRMMPVLVVVGMIFALLSVIRNWQAMRAYLLNFAVLVAVAFMVFVPLFRYSVQYPESFWSRTSARLMGDEIITSTNELGQTITHYATTAERLEVFKNNIGILGRNLLKALQMFNYRGDIIFLHNAPTYPHLDPLLGAFLIVGLAGWLMWLDRRGDSVDWLVIPAIVIMLLPSALAIALPNENPSTTRASGALPLVLFLVSFGVASLYLILKKVLPSAGAISRRVVPVVASVLLVGVVYSYTSWVVFAPYRTIYFESWHAISEGGRIMRGFVEGGSNYGNVFILSYPYWWDYRAVAMEGGLKPGRWINGDISLDELPSRMLDSSRGNNPFPLDVTKDLLFFYHKDDITAENQFKAWFPQGYSTLIDIKLRDVSDPEFGIGTPYPDKDFKIYRVPALGAEGFDQFVAANGLQ